MSCRREDLGRVEVSGPGARAFLQRLVTADLRALAPGDAVPAALLTPKAQVVALLRVIVRGEEALSCVVDRALVPTVLALLDRYSIGHAVNLEASAGEVVGLYGPGLRACTALGAAAALAPYAQATLVAGGACWLALGDDELGGAGLLLFGPADSHAGAALSEWLRPAPVLALEPAAFEVARLEAGAPRMGVDVDAETMLLEAGQLSAVSFEKGCYPGQEPVCRVHSRGQVNWRLLALRAAADRLPAAGETLRHRALAEAGRITSAAYSPTLDAIVALGYVHRRALENPGALELAGGGRAEVVALPRVPGLLVPLSAPRYGEGAAAR
ncbi:MAG: hypothetical protein IPL40_04600 [Proteobacteria bacterium]|nr:hypothetical protein [Pseudomonadota bacterium]